MKVVKRCDISRRAIPHSEGNADKMAGDNINEAELGRSKQSTTPRDHLLHLLNIGWNPRSPLILKYAQEHGLMRDLEEAARETNKS